MSKIYNSTENLVADTGESFVKNINTSTATLVKSGNSTLNGIMVNSHTSGTIEIRDGLTYVAATSPVKFGTITLIADVSKVSDDRMIYFQGARFNTGILVYTGGTVDITVLYK